MFKGNHQDAVQSPARRQVIAGLGSAGLAMALGPAGLVHAAAAPKQGGTLRVADYTMSNTDTFNPMLARAGSDYIRLKTIYSSLCWINERGEATPDLAQSYEMDSTATTWTFKLRKGVQFHDGSPLRPEDVTYSIGQHIKGPSLAGPIVANIKDMRIDGPDTVVFELHAPDVDFPISMSEVHLAIVKAGTTDFLKPVGTGPFKLKEFQPGIRTVGVRNPNYWRTGRPYIDQYELTAISDTQARVNALLAGDVDVAVDISGTVIGQVKQSSSAHLFSTPTAGFTSIHCRMDLAPSSNLDLRLALAYLMDRQRYLDVVLQGYGSIANDVPIPVNDPWYDTSLPKRALDPDKAKFHFKKSAIGTHPIEIYVTSAAKGGIDMGQLLQRQAAEIGMQIALRSMPPDGYWANVSGMHPFTNNHATPRPSDSMNLTLFWKSKAPFNKCHFVAPGFDQIVDRIMSEKNVDARKALFVQAQKLIYDAAPQIIPAMQNYVDAVSNRVQGLTPVPVGYLGGFNGLQELWIA